ncbi:hydantoinase/oxoprolinase family protein [Methanosphaera sp. ISO3-F5]|uniref:hydantoinase/oxoprolinase family protein n=1 Tax=Methanosphaera sp. ISO3-F5 TaxID=1452353 RepID=UPI002B263F58|nr:hydantoinase/oxoprolinase family protein [Methanosphaera sp. ISO3-F5]WQH63216.1 hydantoinase/oxoprolinase family protein [Methanosphaera sp. ISO3-F5]
MKIMGLDIGGANTDCSIIEIKDKKIVNLKNYREYFPMWKNKDQLQDCLKKFCRNEEDIDVVCVSMTAELADGYNSKKEGVEDISQKVMEIFNDKEVYFVTFEGLKTYTQLKENPLNAAAANWIGTAELIKHIGKDCIFIDMGSTTTDIIPIKNLKESASGHTDLERLSTGELIYTGMLRTNLTSIVHTVPIYRKSTCVSSELFTITGDIHRILNNIQEEDYTCDTPDGNDKSIKSCKRRLARLVCADLDTLDDEEIIKLAEYIEKKQLEQIVTGLNKVVTRTKIDTAIIVSYGSGNLCQKAVEKLNMNVIPLEKYISKKVINVITSLGAIQMYLDKKDKNIVLLEEI